MPFVGSAIQMLEENESHIHSEYHFMWRNFSGSEGGDVQLDGYKNALLGGVNGWYVGSALSMTVGFALLSLDMPPIERYGEIENIVVRWLFLFLVLVSIVAGVTGVFVGGTLVEDFSIVPAALYSELMQSMPRQSWNYTTPFRWAHFSIIALSFSMAPLCYMKHGRCEAVLAFVAHLSMCASFETS